MKRPKEETIDPSVAEAITRSAGSARSRTKRKEYKAALLTPEVQDRICAAIRGGSFLAAAATYAGIRPDTVAHWIARGEAEAVGPYRDFLDAVAKAEADLEVSLAAMILKGARISPKMALALIGRRFPKVWGKQVHHDHTGTVKVEDARQRVADRLSRALESARTETDPGEPDRTGSASAGPRLALVGAADTTR